MGRFISADTIVPDGTNPQAFNRYAYTYNNPLKYIDPTGHCGEGSTPGQGVSQEHHDLMCKLHDEALRLNDLVQKGELTDVEALAMLLGFGAPLYTQYSAAGEPTYNEVGFIRDLGTVVGGIEIRGNLIQHGLSRLLGTFRPEDASRLIADPADPTANARDVLGQYYIGYNVFRAEPTGFAWQYAEPGENQVRHFIGGLTAGIVFLGQGRPTLLNRETPGSPDYNLHLKAFELADNLDVNQASTWVLKNLATWPVKLMHGIVKPGGR